MRRRRVRAKRSTTRRREKEAAPRRGRSRSPSPERCARRRRRTTTFPGRARGPRRARRALLRRASDVAEPRGVLQLVGRVADGGRWTVARRGERHRRNPLRQEGRLLVKAEREGEIEQLPQRAGAAGPRRVPVRASARRPLSAIRRWARAACRPRTPAGRGRGRRSHPGR